MILETQPQGLRQLRRLTVGELVLIYHRRRYRNKDLMANALGVPRKRIDAWEKGRSVPPEYLWRPMMRGTPELRPHETCLLYRLRAGYTQARVAKTLGRSRQWVGLMERGERPCDELLWYWES